MTDVFTGFVFYKSLILPHFGYCSEIYVLSLQENLNKLQLIQNFASRTFFLAKSKGAYRSTLSVMSEATMLLIFYLHLLDITASFR